MARKSAKPPALDFLTAPNIVRSGMFEAAKAEVDQAIPVEISHLLDNPYQPRLSIKPEALKELSDVIEKQGFLGVLVARPHPEQNNSYQIVAGHRRRDAARLAGLKTIPVVVKELLDEEMAAIAITENIQREDLTPLEEGKLFLHMAEEMGFTHELIAKAIGKNRGYVENRLRVARAPADIQELVQDKPDSLRAVATLIKVEDPTQRNVLITGLRTGKLTTDDVSRIAERTPVKPRQQRHVWTEQEVGKMMHTRLSRAFEHLRVYRETLEKRTEFPDGEMLTLSGLVEIVEEIKEQLKGHYWKT